MSDTGQSFEQALSGSTKVEILLRLFVAGYTARSQATIATLLGICEKCMCGRYQLEVVDIYQQPELARQQQIIATPTLVRYFPSPKKMLIGDLTRTERLLSILGPAV